MHFTWCTLAWAPLGAICMHFYLVYIRLASSGCLLYAFLLVVHSPGFAWEPFVCIFTWCTLALSPLGTICMHFYVVYTRLGSPGNYLTVRVHFSSACLLLNRDITEYKTVPRVIRMFNRARVLGQRLCVEYVSK